MTSLLLASCRGALFRARLLATLLLGLSHTGLTKVLLVITVKVYCSTWAAATGYGLESRQGSL